MYICNMLCIWLHTIYDDNGDDDAAAAAAAVSSVRTHGNDNKSAAGSCFHPQISMRHGRLATFGTPGFSSVKLSGLISAAGEHPPTHHEH